MAEAELPRAPEAPESSERDYLEGRLARLETELEFEREMRHAERLRRTRELWLDVGLLAGFALGYYYATTR